MRSSERAEHLRPFLFSGTGVVLMTSHVSFEFFAPATFFQKADGDASKRKRIAGVVSDEIQDKQEETIIQKGLDFSPFLKEGWFNDNHSKRTTDILGYPESVSQFRKGDMLPDGQRAVANGTWAEGYLLDTPDAQKVWDLGLALQKSGNSRRLGFSIEGSVLQRTGPHGKIVAKALVRNVAITNCPVGQGTRMEVLAKSLMDMEKGLSMGTAAPGVNPSAQGPTTGEGAGKILAPQHLEEGGVTDLLSSVDDDDEDDVKKSEAVAIIQTSLGCDRATAERAYRTLSNMKAASLL